MSKLGKLTVGPPSQHLVNGVVTADNADAVAMVYLHGSRGGFKDAQLIGQEDAERCARQLAERAGISATGGTCDESLSDLTARMRADVAEIARRMKSGELPDNFMDRESFACLDVGLKRFEYYAKSAPREKTDDHYLSQPPQDL